MACKLLKGKKQLPFGEFMNKSISALVLALAAGFATSAQATVTETSTGLAAYDQLVTFSAPSLASNTVVTNQYAAQGLTFTALGGGAVRANSCGISDFDGLASLSGDTLNTYGPTCVTNGTDDAFSMKFSADVSAVSFSLVSVGYSNIGNTISAYNDGNLVEQFSFGAGDYFADYLQFSNLTFDELRFTEGGGDDSYFIFDNVAYVNANAVPEPVSLSLFGLGLAGLAAARRKSKKSA
jgi:hypothetical protein